MPPLRALHFSDVHVTSPLADVPLADWHPKRVLGAANLMLRRRHRFADAREKLAALERFRREQDVTLSLCTGDYTVLGTLGELHGARAAIEPLTHAPDGFVTVPGNHDVYVHDGVREGRFEQVFGDLLGTDLPEHRVDGPWPLVRLIGHDVAVIAINSARPNPQLWRSSGRIPDIQLEALGRALADPRLVERFIFVLTHYAPRLADGRDDRPTHRLVNADALLEVCAPIERGAILHGHVHHTYRVRVPGVGPALFGAGSTTQRGHEGLWLFEVDGSRGRATRGRWDGEGYVLTDDTWPLVV